MLQCEKCRLGTDGMSLGLCPLVLTKRAINLATRRLYSIQKNPEGLVPDKQIEKKPRLSNASKLPATERVHLPPTSEWRTHFSPRNILVRERVSIKNPETAAQVAQSFVPTGSEQKIVIEAYPGRSNSLLIRHTC